MTVIDKTSFEKINVDEKIQLFYQHLQTMVELCSSDHSEDTLQKIAAFSNAYPESSHGYALLGITYSKRRSFDAASINLQKALLLSPIDQTALTCFRALLQDRGRHIDVITILERCISLQPTDPIVWQQYWQSLNSIAYEEYTEAMAKRFIKILEKNNLIRPSQIVNAIIRLLEKKQNLMEIFRIATQSSFNSELQRVISVLLETPLLLKIIELCPIPNIIFEILLRRLRKAFLLHDNLETSNNNYLAIQCSLALHCFTNEYIYGEDKDEAQKLKQLEQFISNAVSEGRSIPWRHIACIASYRPLYKFNWSRNLRVPVHMAKLFLRQVQHIDYELSLRSSIPNINLITEDTSVAVKDQYEDNPYPRWVNIGILQKSMTISEITKLAGIRILSPGSDSSNQLKVLIAGCGTGQHSIEAAVRYANSNITAIDLSLSSLSFALRQTRELNIKNVNYLHGDILDLASWENRFDVIETTGVLHHMSDPMLGWGILKRCLKSKGLMRVGLYSSLAREGLSEVKEKMGELERPITNKKIHDYRNNVLNNAGIEFEKLARYPDFFSTSELRDLLFHVREHTFTLIEIKNMLKELDFIFCGFETVDEKTREAVSVGGGGSENLFSLDAWHNFEQLNPHYFSGMYTFWVQRPD